MDISTLLINISFVMALGFYLIVNLQWYDYKISRVVLKHHKPLWHFTLFVFPFILYYISAQYFVFILALYLAVLSFWYYKLDKKLVFTWRVKRFLILLFVLTLFLDMLTAIKGMQGPSFVFLPLLLAYIGSKGVENFLFMTYKKEAHKKLMGRKDLKIICVTGSYGKTSMKNFIAQVLSKKYKVYATPRSVNTIAGLVRDVNMDLPDDCEVYVCEAGARLRGDIYTIAQFLHPQIAVVGKVGPQHLEYFKSVENIQRTKLEIIQSDRLEKAFVHHSVTDEAHDKVEFFGDAVSHVEATLDGLSFDMQLHNESLHFDTKILGGFNTINLEAAILVADAMEMDANDIVKAVGALKSVEHRLQRIDAGGKIILDDGYNGNIDGMLEGVRLLSLHPGRKVIVTPGLVESTEALNLEFIEAINKVCDMAIITGQLNTELFDKNLTGLEKIMLKDKGHLTKVLGERTRAGDIILFANDAPNFI
ncbi:MAG: UDP-N-acetylmuramoyl-tripeptide--D-alanyl-D-alanine ligase [Helicobacteraceae bacterium]|jgi:UDP-N-acetylmuramoyl-tripeptide--D-alanyl-D-alanine ligase|nr:UDP-N-acetylmuramoyl-tripeptide--D-alanyl-D-alanine ligase [Helicobacteraceae bacterium]